MNENLNGSQTPLSAPLPKFDTEQFNEEIKKIELELLNVDSQIISSDDVVINVNDSDLVKRKKRQLKLKKKIRRHEQKTADLIKKSKKKSKKNPKKAKELFKKATLRLKQADLVRKNLEVSQKPTAVQDISEKSIEKTILPSLISSQVVLKNLGTVTTITVQNQVQAEISNAKSEKVPEITANIPVKPDRVEDIQKTPLSKETEKTINKEPQKTINNTSPETAPKDIAENKVPDKKPDGKAEKESVTKNPSAFCVPYINAVIQAISAMAVIKGAKELGEQLSGEKFENSRLQSVSNSTQESVSHDTGKQVTSRTTTTEAISR